MKTALFIMLPVPSHYNACFGLAEQLQKQGYRVVFSGTEDLQKHVEAQAFEFTTLYCLEEYVINNWQTALGFFLKSIINNKFMLFRYREFLQAVSAVRELCLSFDPDEIFIDQHLNHYYFLLQHYFKKITLVNTKLPTRRVKGIPPLTCGKPFKNDFVHRQFGEVLWEIYLAKSKAVTLFKKFIFLGIDDQFFLNRIALRQGIDVKLYRRRENALYESLRCVPIVHLRPQFLEYDWYILENFEKFIFYPYKKRNETSREFTSAWEVIGVSHKDKDLRKSHLIYASLGTLSELHKSVAIAFFHKLISAVEKLPNTHLIISAGEMFLDIKDRQNENIFIQRYILQAELLPYCDIMITHAGMNSICECLTAGVPMLAYPLNFRSDQPGNAARLVVKGWGIKGDLRRDTELILRENIIELLNNAAYRYNISHINMKPINDWYLKTDLAKS